MGRMSRYGRSWGAVFDRCADCGIHGATVANFGINGVNVTGGRNFALRGRHTRPIP